MLRQKGYVSHHHGEYDHNVLIDLINLKSNLQKKTDLMMDQQQDCQNHECALQTAKNLEVIYDLILPKFLDPDKICKWFTDQREPLEYKYTDQKRRRQVFNCRGCVGVMTMMFNHLEASSKDIRKNMKVGSENQLNLGTKVDYHDLLQSACKAKTGYKCDKKILQSLIRDFNLYINVLRGDTFDLCRGLLKTCFY